MKNAKLWPVPPYKGPKPTFWLVAAFKMSNSEARKLIGEPHFIETDSTRTFGGNEDIWSFELESGQHIGVCSQVPYGIVHLLSDRPEVKEILEALELPKELIGDKSQFETYDPPIRV